MIIEKYGIVLRRLKEADLELVRQKRNSQDIRRFMYYQEEITSEMQKKWFHSIDNIYNYYFIIEHQGKKIGLIHGKNNDYEKGICEGGIFIWDKAYLGTTIPSLASVILNDLTFHTFHLINTVYAKVLKDNKIALHYNKLMGYEPCAPLNDDKNVVWMRLTKANYEKQARKMHLGVSGLIGNEAPLSIDDINFSDDSPEDIERLYKRLPADIQPKVNTMFSR